MATAIFRRPSPLHTTIRQTLNLNFHPQRKMTTNVPPFPSYLVTPSQLSTALAANPPSPISTSPRTIPVCASWFLPNDPQKRTGIDTYRAQRIPNARFFDLDAVCDKHSSYPHMLPSASVFASAMSSLGIRADDRVVVYDTSELGLFSAPRAAWTLRVFGHRGAVHVLNNFRAWVDEGLPLEKGEFYCVEVSNYPIPKKEDLQMHKVIDFEEMREVVRDYNKEGSEGVQVLDARSEGRWRGTAPEPREGLSSGHMPGSISVPVSELLDAKSGKMLGREELRRVFEGKGVDPQRRIITSCGTGVTAAVVDAALAEAGWGEEGGRRLYDGSWT